jgi:hypothetical protein
LEDFDFAFVLQFYLKSVIKICNCTEFHCFEEEFENHSLNQKHLEEFEQRYLNLRRMIVNDQSGEHFDKSKKELSFQIFLIDAGIRGHHLERLLFLLMLKIGKRFG